MIPRNDWKAQGVTGKSQKKQRCSGTKKEWLSLKWDKTLLRQGSILDFILPGQMFGKSHKCWRKCCQQVLWCFITLTWGSSVTKVCCSPPKGWSTQSTIKNPSGRLVQMMPPPAQQWGAHINLKPLTAVELTDLSFKLLPSSSRHCLPPHPMIQIPRWYSSTGNPSHLWSVYLLWQFSGRYQDQVLKKEQQKDEKQGSLFQTDINTHYGQREEHWA